MKIQPYIHVRNTGTTGLSYLKIIIIANNTKQHHGVNIMTAELQQ